MNGNGASIWKWLAASLVLILLAGAPSYISFLRGPSKEEVSIIADRQVNVLQRLAVVEAQILQAHEDLHDLQEEHRQLERQLSK